MKLLLHFFFIQQAGAGLARIYILMTSYKNLSKNILLRWGGVLK